jgi:hypothetical protein
LRIECIEATDCRTAGEALRIVYERDILTNDFVLVSGDVISNLRLQPIIEAHKYAAISHRSTSLVVLRVLVYLINKLLPCYIQLVLL